MASVQRKGTLRVASSYRTMPEPVVLLIAVVILIDLLALVGSIYLKEENKLEGMPQSMKPGNSLSGTVKIDGIGRIEEDRLQGSYQS